MDTIELLSQVSYSVSFLLQREMKIKEHKNKLKEFEGKPYYQTLVDGINCIENEISKEKMLLSEYISNLKYYVDSKI